MDNIVVNVVETPTLVSVNITTTSNLVSVAVSGPNEIPAGGTTGQAILKASNADYDVTWGTVSGGGGGYSLATRYQVMEQFLLNANGGGVFQFGATQVTGGSSAPTNIDALYGVWSVACGTTATSLSAGRMLSQKSFSMMLDAIKTIRFRFRRTTSANFDGTNQGNSYIGFCEAQGGSTPQNAVCFQLSNGGTLKAYTSQAYASGTVDTGLTLNQNQWYEGCITVNAPGTEAKFYLDGALIATITTNLPVVAGQYVSLGFFVVKTTAHSVSVDMQVDFMMVDLTPTVPFYNESVPN